MKNNSVIVGYLKKLSPVFEKLIERAFKENVLILSDKKFFRIVGKIFPLIKNDKKTVLWTFYSTICGQIIVVGWPEIKYNVWNGELGLIEIGFSHEIGHVLSQRKRPFCHNHPSLSFSIQCEYREILAYYLGLQILAEIRRELHCTEQPFFKGKRMTYLEILHHFNFSHRSIDRAKKCRGIKICQLKKCPKEKEIKILASKIERCRI